MALHQTAMSLPPTHGSPAAPLAAIPNTPKWLGAILAL